MTNVSSSTGTTGSTSASGTARTSLSGSFDTFLTLLTTQLKNQSPDDPLDTNDMTAQLVQFASVEQQIAMNTNLEKMIALQQTSQLTAAAPMLGQKVEVESTTLPLQDGTATVRLPAAGTASTVRVAIKDSSGKTVKEQQLSLTTAQQDWVWDGRNSSGTQLADGAYTVAVTGADVSGNAVSTSFTVVGKATAAERSKGALTLRMGAASYDFDDVRSVTQ